MACTFRGGLVCIVCVNNYTKASVRILTFRIERKRKKSLMSSFLKDCLKTKEVYTCNSKSVFEVVNLIILCFFRVLTNVFNLL